MISVVPVFASIIRSASSITVRFRSPRKSILIRPRDSSGGWSNWVMIAPSSSRFMMGSTSSSGSADMITPAACTPHWRLRFSIPFAVSKTRAASPSVSMRARMSAASLYRSASLLWMSPSGMSLPMTGGGIALVSFSPTEYGMPSTLEESFSACLALMVPYVTIWATRSSPYFSVT